MNIVLVRPPILIPLANQTAIPSPPIGLAYIAGALRAAGHQVTAIDGLGMAIDVRTPVAKDCFLCGATLEDVVQSIDPDAEMIGVSAAFSFEWPMCRDLIVAIRQRFPQAILLAGGEHATAMPEYCLADSPLDIVVQGEGEETIVELADRLSSGGVLPDLAATPGTVIKLGGDVVKGPPRQRVRDIDSLAWPAWDLLPIGQYLDRGLGFGVNRGRSMPIMASRGCPYRCTFCSSPQMWTTKWLARDPHALLEEIRHYMAVYGATNFDFYDLTAIVKKDWIITFCTLLIEADLNITWQLPSGTRSEALDEQICQLLYRSGCRNVSYAPESGSPVILERIKKKISTDKMIASMRGAVSAGLNVKANIIFGFPQENYRDIAHSMKFIVSMALAGVHDLSIWAFSPYPGSELFDKIKAARNIQINDDYFNHLRAYADNSKSISYSEYFGDVCLRRLRFVGVVIFYVVSWLRRPWRPFKIVYNLFSGVQESRGDMALANMVKKYAMKLRWGRT